VEKKKIRKNELEKTQIARVSQVFYLACVRIQHSPRKHITSVANLQPEVIEVTTIHHLQHETPRAMCVRIEGSGADTGLAKSLHHVVTLARGCNRCSARPTQSGELL